jgi:hypothetical protein
MKHILAGLVLTVAAVSANAQHHGWRHGYHGHYGGNGWGWVVPAVVGGAVVYAATRPPVVVQQQPVIVQQPPAEVVYIDGIAYKKQIMVINGQTQEVLVRI